MKTITKPEEDVDNERAPNFLDTMIIKLGEFLSVLFLITVAISFYEVLMRYVFNSPTTWVHESATFFGGLLFVIGGSYVLARNKHVRVVLIYDNVSQKVRHLLNIFHHIMGLFFSAMMVYGSYEMAYKSWIKPWGDIKLETTGSVWDPAFPAYLKAIIFVVFVVMFIQFSLYLIAEIKAMRNNNV